MARFVGRLALAAFAASLAWLVVREPFGAGFRSAGNGLFAALGAAKRARLAPEQAGKLATDTVLALFDAAGTGRIAINFASLWHAYVPLAVFCCLAAAAGHWRWASWRRLVLGLVAVAAFCALRLLLVAASFALREPSMGLAWSAPLPWVVDFAFLIIARPAGLEYAVPAVIWYASAARTVRADEARAHGPAAHPTRERR